MTAFSDEKGSQSFNSQSNVCDSQCNVFVNMIIATCDINTIDPINSFVKDRSSPTGGVG